MAGIFLNLFTFIETGLVSFLGRDGCRGVEKSPEELGALDEGEVGGLGKRLIGQLFRGRGQGTPL